MELSLRKQLTELESKISQKFSELRVEKIAYVFISDEDVDSGEIESDEYLEIRNDITGEVCDVHPIKVSDVGILVVEANDTTKFHTIGLNDLANTFDKISLLELMEQL